jgi:hypothetical protein
VEALSQAGENLPEEALNFAVLDEEDLAVMSAHLQDALLVVGDTAFLPKSQKFAAVVSRIDWRSMVEGRQCRRRAGFHFERVIKVQRSGFEPHTKDKTLQLLAVSFKPTAAPSGEVMLTFSGNNLIKLDVECLEAAMKDLGESFPVRNCPRHVLDETSVGG